MKSSGFAFRFCISRALSRAPTALFDDSIDHREDPCAAPGPWELARPALDRLSSLFGQQSAAFILALAMTQGLSADLDPDVLVISISPAIGPPVPGGHRG